MSLLLWGEKGATNSTLIQGDNMAALSDAIALRGKGAIPGMNIIARELAWRKAAFGWEYQVAHLPKELNLLADALSRAASIPPAPQPVFPTGTRQRNAPDLSSQVWVTCEPA
jgi:hypothetical protein